MGIGGSRNYERRARGHRQSLATGRGRPRGALALVAVGSGVVRPRQRVYLLNPDQLSGFNILRLDARWPLAAVGLGVGAASIVLAVVSLGTGNTLTRAVVSGVGLFLLAGALVGIAITLRERTEFGFVV